MDQDPNSWEPSKECGHFDLLPCPFCGQCEELDLMRCPEGCSVYISCATCGADGPIKPSPEEAVAHWNGRAKIF